MLKKSNKLTGSFYLEWILFVVVIVLIFTSWRQEVNKELEAQPIVIDRNVSHNPKGNKSTSLMLSDSGDKPDAPSGYAPEGLGQPCQQNPQKKLLPNLPGSHQQQECDSTLGLVCIHGLVEGGGICLKNINQECSAKGECTPLADGCVYGYCQQYGDVINKPCTDNSQCRGNGEFNHVCDPISKRCKFDIFPKDSGCVLSEQCTLYTPDKNAPNQSSCLDQQPLVTYSTTFTSNRFTITGETILRKDYYISILSPTEGFLGRYLIKTITYDGTNTFINVGNFYGSGANFTIELGNPEGGICLIDYPLGTKRQPVIKENPKILFPCEQGLDTLNNFCVEKGRTNTLGKEGQVCILQEKANQPLGCQSKLKCTFDETFNSKLLSNFNVVGTGSKASIGDIFVNNIGKCASQTAISREICDDSQKACKSPNICLRQKIYNQKTPARYCGRFWDTFDVSTLIGCPTNYTLKNNNCLANKNYICIKNSDCLDNKCGTHSLDLSSYNLEKQIFEKYKFEKYSFGQNAPQGSKILMSKDFGSDDSTPTAAGYYHFNNSVLTININTDNGTSTRTKVITFEDTSITEPVVSVIKKSDTSQQINVIYQQKYQNYTRREYFFKQTGGIIDSDFALRQGASIFFEANTGSIKPKGIYSLDYGDVSGSGSNAQISSLTLIEGADDFYTTTIKKQTTNYKMVSYDSGYKFNKNIIDLPLKFISSNTNSTTNNFNYLNLYPGTSMKFFSNSTTGVCFYQNSTPLPLVNERDYYNVGVSGSTTLMLTDDIDTIFGEPVIGGTSISQLGVSVSITSGQYETDSGFLQLPEMSGINIFTLEVKDSDPLGTTGVSIKKRKELYSPNTNITDVQYNYPVGFFFPSTTSVDVQVGVSEIILTNKINKLNHQITQVKYNTSYQFDTDYRYQSGNKTTNANQIEIEFVPPDSTTVGTSTLYTNFEITNIYNIPNAKIYSDSKYSTITNEGTSYDYPYEIDEVKKYIYQTDETNTINVLSSFKNINPERSDSNLAYNRINIMNETTLRKVGYNGFVGKDFQNIEYQGITSSPKNASSNTMNVNPLLTSYGYCCPIEISPLQAVKVSSNSGNNHFLPGSPELYIKNSSDIDTIMKYSSSEIVIGIHTNQKNTNAKTQLKSVPDRYIAIVGILDYLIDAKLSETLILSTNTLLDASLISGARAYLFVNNIVPIVPVSIGPLTFSDGSLIITSCIPEKTDSFNGLTSYNKIYLNTGVDPKVEFHNIRYYEESTPNPNFNDIFFTKNGTNGYITKSGNNFIGSNFVLQGQISIDPGISYLVNNLFMSSLSLQKAIIINGVTRNIVDRVIWGGQINRRGSYCMYVNTVPFYNSFSNGNQGSLDLSYKTPLYWSYWITELNKIPIEIVKIINNFNPGNIENNMFYYALAKIQGEPYLLFLSTNSNFNNIAESQPVPVKLSKNFTESIASQFFMTPYDKKLNYLTSYCSS